jgi:rubrerythrin
MDAKQRRLAAEVRKGSQAYVRNLVAAEAAVQRGQFNVAKVLRAAAHAQRVLAMEAARLSRSNRPPAVLLRALLREFVQAPRRAKVRATARGSAARAERERAASVRSRLRGILQRSVASLEHHPDVLESDVAQHLWGCYGCGAIAEGERPEACAVCGALSPEFEWFGPFYNATPEHLGQLRPDATLATLERMPNELSRVFSRTDDLVLRGKPSPTEWCAKEIAGHMVETDLLFLRRVRAMLATEDPVDITTPVPPWKLQEGKGYETLSGSDLADRFSRARAETLSLVQHLKAGDWTRRGINRTAGQYTTVSLLDLGTWLANHDMGHLAQIRRLCGRTVRKLISYSGCAVVVAHGLELSATFGHT